MTRFLHARALQHPEKIHPGLWRGSQLAHSFQQAVSTGYPDLDAQLPGQGWPGGTLIEIMLARPGMGEIQLLKPALLKLRDARSIVLVNPPHMPSAPGLRQWFPDPQRILWIRPDTTRNALWAIEKILQHNTCSALLCWFDQAHPVSVHRIHLAARQSDTLLFSLRPASCTTQSSMAPLRLSLEPGTNGLHVRVLKRRGPLLKIPILLNLNPSQPDSSCMSFHYHDTLDQHSPARTKQRPRHDPDRHRHNVAAIHT